MNEFEGSYSIVRLVYRIGEDNVVGGARVSSGEGDTERWDNKYPIEVLEAVVIWFQPGGIEGVACDFEREVDLRKVGHAYVSGVRGRRMFIFPNW